MSASERGTTVSWWLGKICWLLRGAILGPTLRWLLGYSHRRRVPVIFQMTFIECGAVCLTMILNYYGRPTSLGECREVCGIGRDGLTAGTIAKAGRHFGLRVKGYSVDLTDFRYVPLPAIAHWNFNHFVVVERWLPTRVDIVDPAAGRRSVPMDEFDTSFTGVVLTLEPDVHFARVRTSARPSWHVYLSQILRLRGTVGVLGQILAASLILQILGLAVPVLTKILVDNVLPFRVASVMPILGLGLAVLVTAQLVTAYLRAALLICLQGRLDSHLMLGFFEHVLSLPFRFFQERSSGDLLMRLGSNQMIRDTLTSQTTSAVLDGAFVMVYLVILLLQDRILGGLALGLGLIEVALLVATSRLVYQYTQRELLAEADSDSYLVEALAGIATLKASGAESRALDHWSNLFFRHLNVSLQREQVSAVIETATTTLHTFAPLALLWVGAVRVLNGSMTLGTMLALSALASAFLAPLSSLVASGRRLQLVRAHVDRLIDVIEAEPEQDPKTVRIAPPLSGRIELRNVNFRYDPNGPWVLHDVSLRIEPGQKVALVGRTGSGKSTLALLLLGLYPPSEGEILYDGIPLHQLSYTTLRSQFGVVLQEPSVFSGSIRQNIAFNDPGIPLEQVEAAARLAEIHDEIAAMPMGYETLIAEGGIGLSGGQIQRLCLARALAHQPAILLLDEATSHLDVMTEAAIDHNLSDIACTRIVVAHRLSTIRNAEVIVVLDGGVVAEHGTHQQLLKRGGPYASLVRSQVEATSTDRRSTQRNQSSVTNDATVGAGAAGDRQSGSP